jgi:hypothetical protein
VGTCKSSETGVQNLLINNMKKEEVSLGVTIFNMNKTSACFGQYWPTCDQHFKGNTSQA